MPSNQGHTALFILGSANHAASVVDAFKKFHGTIVEATVEPDARKRLQQALDAE
ncbi:MAG: DUF1269 domain-containing protein [Anaerolineae bacterium]|nr:DUF1269 domain-containing protein [Anaerolineae bacterium]